MTKAKSGKITGPVAIIRRHVGSRELMLAAVAGSVFVWGGVLHFLLT